MLTILKIVDILSPIQLYFRQIVNLDRILDRNIIDTIQGKNKQLFLWKHIMIKRVVYGIKIMG